MRANENMSDSELVEKLREGDIPAFTQIYERYWALLLHHAIGMLRDEDAAKDAVQDVFTSLWARAAELNIHTSLSSFLYTSVRYRIIDQMDHSKIREKYMLSFQEFADKGEFTTDNLVLENELSQRIEAEVAKLPLKMREVFELSRKHNLSHKEISTKLTITDHTVKRQISKALTLLRGKLSHPFLFFI